MLKGRKKVRSKPKGALQDTQEYVRRTVAEPQVLQVIGEESRSKGTDILSVRQIDRVIKSTRAIKSKR
jgi:hypothetical protein